ncbi:MAG: N-acetylglucosamine-specific PTS transporter subunit IIBC [Ancrocorticia sp.]|uniref:N-acetylglucosamine-specific PTS transporter subunit IIBC n=1 Tax=Ancrocorticia sp. TaxID=2593684 RepID=UPI003F8EE78A
MKFMQNLGKSFMLPVAVLPVAAILVGIAYWIENVAGENVVQAFLAAAGGALLDNIPILFAVGVSIGMAVKSDGTSALAGLVSWLTMQTLLKPETVAAFQHTDVENVNPAFGVVDNVFIGIIAGLIGAYSYNRFRNTRLPDALSFFSGRRSVAIVAAGMSLITGAILFFVWPLVYTGLVSFGEFILTLGPLGAGLYGFFNRMLIPLGLHHALNSVFWFDVAGINDLNNFLNATGTYGVTGQYMTGFFPVMMFGLPGAALAMYVTAKSNKRKVAAGLLLSASVSSFFVGVTEPLEFSFMFLAPALYVVHALFMGISMAISFILPVRMGFGFSGGFIDVVLGWVNPMAQNPWLLIVMGLVWFVIYFFVFRFLILKLDLKTPGREDDDAVPTVSGGTGEDPYLATATGFIKGLGGKDNITDLDNCATRLRLQLGDLSQVDEAELKRAGAAGTMKSGGKSFQVIYGLNVQFVKDAMEQIMSAESSTNVAIATEVVDVTSPLAGDIVPLAEIPDAGFASGAVGQGVGIDPSSGRVVAPATGTVILTFPTGHAVGLRLDSGVELLIHIGLDTVNMEGRGFDIKVKKGDQVTAGQLLATFDIEEIKRSGYSPITPVIVTNHRKFASVQQDTTGTVAEGADLLKVTPKG